jgi:predicted Zn finger-like uncharacterized protein
MIIECPHCGTRFRLDAKLSDSRSMLKCARCRRVFPAPGQSPSPRRPRRPPADDNMSFSFDDDDEWRAPELTSDDVPEDAFLLNAPADPEAEPAARPRRPRAARPMPGQESLRFDDPDEDETDEDDVTPERGPAVDDVEDLYADPVFTMRAPPTAPAEGARRGGISVRSVFVFLAVVVGGYGALTWSLLDDPDWATRLTRGIPVVGASLRDASAGDDIALVDVRGRYERTKDGKVVFVITGKAVNQSADTLRAVQIISSLQDAGERQLERQVTACGNALEARIRELSVHQVGILRSIKPPPDLGMQPGSNCPFVAIFLEVPPAATTFTTEVVRAQRYA